MGPLQPRAGPSTPQRARAAAGSLESSPLLPPGGRAAHSGTCDPEERELKHRCGRPSRFKPYLLASVAVGAGSLAQGCGRSARFLRAVCRSPATALARRRSYDGTAIGFLLTTHFGGYVPARARRG